MSEQLLQSFLALQNERLRKATEFAVQRVKEMPNASDEDIAREVWKTFYKIIPDEPVVNDKTFQDQVKLIAQIRWLIATGKIDEVLNDPA